MGSMSRVSFLLILSLLFSLGRDPVQAQEGVDVSVFKTRPADDHAPTFNGSACANEVDCTPALQRAVDELQSTRHQGVLWIPEGHYHLTGTVTVWTGIRLIGFGDHRPVFVVRDGTPGFSETKPRPLFHFAHERPKDSQPVQDGTSETFYSAFENLDIEVGAGNPSISAIRFHVAQHGILSHLRIHMTSGHAALEDVGNVAFNVHLLGGDFGIDTVKTAPGWPFMLMDSQLEGQHIAGIRTREAGMTLERVTISDVPVAIAIPQGQVEQLFVSDSTFRSVSDTAIQTGDVRNARSQISAQKLGCIGVRRLLPALGAAEGVAEESGNSGADTQNYVVDRLRLGIAVGADGGNGGVRLSLHAHPGRFPEQATDVAVLPAVSDWVSVRPLGAIGDGLHDDTEALQAAINTHRVLFFPAGRFRLTRTLHLRPDTVLLGVHPFATQIVLADRTPSFGGEGPRMPLIETPVGGANILSGIGISAGAFNPRAAGVLWRAGPHSLLEDVKFYGGRGTLSEAGKTLQVYPPAAGAPAEVSAGWSTQYPSLMVQDGGGGVFRAIWSASAFARAGLLIENTSTRGRVYGFSCEHHLHNEVVLHGLDGWQFAALQTEEEKLEGRDALSLEVQKSRDVSFGNLFQYRVSRSLGPADHATEIGPDASVDFANVHVFAGGRYAYDHSLLDLRSGVRSRVRDFVALDTSKPLVPGPVGAVSPLGGEELHVIASGFTDITGLIAEPDGSVLFTDASDHRLLNWKSGSQSVTSLPLPGGFSPVVILAATSRNIDVLGADGRVLRLSRSGGSRELQTATLPVNSSLRIPIGGHSNLSALNPLLHASTGVDLGEATGWMPVAKDLRPLLYGSQFATQGPSRQQLLASEDEGRVVRLPATPGAAPFMEGAFTAIVQDQAGEVFLAGEQIEIQEGGGRILATIDVPQRPTSLAIGGGDEHTLFVGARSNLYALRLPVVKTSAHPLQGRAAKASQPGEDVQYAFRKRFHTAAK